MAKKLTPTKRHSSNTVTDVNINKSQSLINSDKTKIPFALAFRCKLDTGYNFKNFKNEDLKNFQKFLDKVSNMTISQVDSAYLRNPDTKDKYGEDKIQVQHYGFDTFRIHGIWENRIFYVLRLDPSHKVHN